MALLSKIISHPSAVDYFKELAFYNKPIEKPKIKHLFNSKCRQQNKICASLQKSSAVFLFRNETE